MSGLFDFSQRRNVEPQEEQKTKVCVHCDRELPLSEFYTNKYAKDGLQSWCKACCKEYYFARRDKAMREMKAKRAADKAAVDKEALASLSSGELIDELARRGYVGTLRKRKEETITIEEE